MDQQGLDFRGAVSADTAWELCCRLLSLEPRQNKLGTRDLAQLLVYWFEEGQVPAQMAQRVYDGMEADLHSRNKSCVTVEDDQVMKCRWVRQAIHAEIDSIREECAAGGQDLPVDLEVDGEIAQNLQQPANAEATEQATLLLQGLRDQGSSSVPTGADEPCPDAATPAAEAVLPGKPLVEAPEFADRVRDTDKDPYWIPGAFPTIFQNQTGDLHNYFEKEPDMLTWGPHIMRSRGWHAQAHMTFSYWWLNMVQRTQVLSAKILVISERPLRSATFRQL